MSKTEPRIRSEAEKAEIYDFFMRKIQRQGCNDLWIVVSEGLKAIKKRKEEEDGNFEES